MPDTQLSNKQIRILKYIRRYQKQGKILSKFHHNADDYTFFGERFNNDFLYYSFEDENLNKDTIIKLTFLSESILDNRQTDRIRFWIPTVLSIIAILGGYRQELALILQIIVRLLTKQ